MALNMKKIIKVNDAIASRSREYFPYSTVGFLENLPQNIKIGLVANAMCRLCHANCTRIKPNGEAIYYASTKKNQKGKCQK